MGVRPSLSALIKPTMFMNFGLIGAAGYIAPRHMEAIDRVGGTLICALDKSDSVGILDRFSYDIDFFTEFERFDRHVNFLKATDKKLDYVSICSPNYLHDAHIRFALRSETSAICEKPLTIKPWNAEALLSEETSDLRVYTVLQLRYHPAMLALKERISKSNERHQVVLKYLTSRGKWYRYSWKGDEEKSGGILTNIGIHFFDALLWIFGPMVNYKARYIDDARAGGSLELKNADVSWQLSVNKNDIPGKSTTYRSMIVDDEEIDFTGGFTDLHIEVYKQIINGAGYGILDALPAIDLTYKLRGK